MSGILRVKTPFTEWQIGWKAAYVYVAPDLRTLKFAPMSVHADVYGVDADAACASENRPRHNAPEHGCRCGFNAWDSSKLAIHYLETQQGMDDANARRAWHPRRQLGRKSIALLRVGLRGRVVVGTLNAGEGWNKWGYRAEHQQTTDVFFEKRCVTCGGEARYVCAMSKEYVNSDKVLPLRPLCADHTSDALYVLQMSSLAARNDVGMYWHYPSE